MEHPIVHKRGSQTQEEEHYHKEYLDSVDFSFNPANLVPHPIQVEQYLGLHSSVDDAAHRPIRVLQLGSPEKQLLLREGLYRHSSNVAASKEFVEVGIGLIHLEVTPSEAVKLFRP